MSDDWKWFERPSRTTLCASCHGTGTTVRGYALTLDHEPGHREGAPATTIRAVVVGASSIHEAVHEAHAIASHARRPVGFDFNSAFVVVHPVGDPEEIIKAWWLATYGETQEATAKRR